MGTLMFSVSGLTKRRFFVELNRVFDIVKSDAWLRSRTAFGSAGH